LLAAEARWINWMGVGALANPTGGGGAHGAQLMRNWVNLDPSYDTLTFDFDTDPQKLELTYNPDWAVLVEKDGTQHLYLVVETKSSLFTDDLRDKESAKIECGKAHFTALVAGENPARYVVARSVGDLLAEAEKG